MDPVSRRFMWEVIADLSKSMSIVLTTHSMEEVGALCSRVGIMVNGALACIGSLEHLKQKYGKGFQVEIHTSEHRIDDVRAFISDLFDGAEEQEYHAGRIKYLIPKQEGAHAITLAQIFSRIEAQKDALAISDYGVGGASLEQIFVTIARGQDHAQAEARANHNDKREAKQQH
jgi:ABC-type multidrug transport system ATPase subunit